MSLILNGIDLPKDVKEVCVMYKDKDGWLQSPIVKDIVQIPKGARLIDANAIYIGSWDIDTDLADQIRNAPTILESEEE